MHLSTLYQAVVGYYYSNDDAFQFTRINIMPRLTPMATHSIQLAAPLYRAVD